MTLKYEHCSILIKFVFPIFILFYFHIQRFIHYVYWKYYLVMIKIIKNKKNLT